MFGATAGEGASPALMNTDHPASPLLISCPFPPLKADHFHLSPPYHSCTPCSLHIFNITGRFTAVDLRQGPVCSLQPAFVLQWAAAQQGGQSCGKESVLSRFQSLVWGREGSGAGSPSGTSTQHHRSWAPPGLAGAQLGRPKASQTLPTR